MEYIVFKIYGWLALLMFFWLLGFFMKKTPESNLFAMLFVAAVGAAIWPAIVVAVEMDRRDGP